MTTDRSTRKLAVILHADVMGSTALVQREETLEDDIRPEARIGIAIGEVVSADGTLSGSDVVMAQRIERLAEPGGICIQGTA